MKGEIYAIRYHFKKIQNGIMIISPPPKIHLHHRSYIYGTGNIDEKKEKKCYCSQNTRSLLKKSKRLHRQDQNNSNVSGNIKAFVLQVQLPAWGYWKVVKL